MAELMEDTVEGVAAEEADQPVEEVEDAGEGDFQDETAEMACSPRHPALVEFAATVSNVISRFGEGATFLA